MAEVQILSDGFLSDDDDHVRSTVGFVRDGEALVVIDPGMVSSPAAILDPLATLGVQPDQVTDVVLSHHHPDHTLKAALFPKARVHDHWAWYLDDVWTSREAEGFEVSPAVTLWETPGHTPQDVSTIVDTDEGVWVFTHLWWTSEGPADDPYSTDPDALHRNRERVLAIPGLHMIAPGHGPAFTPDADTPR